MLESTRKRALIAGDMENWSWDFQLPSEHNFIGILVWHSRYFASMPDRSTPAMVNLLGSIRILAVRAAAFAGLPDPSRDLDEAMRESGRV